NGVVGACRRGSALHPEAPPIGPLLEDVLRRLGGVARSTAEQAASAHLSGTPAVALAGNGADRYALPDPAALRPARGLARGSQGSQHGGGPVQALRVRRGEPDGAATGRRPRSVVPTELGLLRSEKSGPAP